MLKVEDLIKILRSNSLVYLYTLVPGLFFLIAVGVANPQLSAGLTARVQTTNPFGPYASLFAVLLCTFVIGATFVTLVNLIQHLLALVYDLWFSLKPILLKHALLPLLNRLLAIPVPLPNAPPPKPKPRWLLQLHRKTIEQAFPPSAADDPAFRWWEALAKQLLRKQYGMKEDDLPAVSLQPIREVLTEPTPREQHGDLMFIALHATGWSALAAAYFAPALQTTWFYLFAFFLIGNGLLHDIVVVRLLRDPAVGDLLRLRAVLREFPKLKSQPIPENNDKGNAKEG